MNMCIIFSVILMPKTEKHLCRHRITKFATSGFCFKSNRTKVYLQKTRNQKRNDEFNLNKLFFPIDSMSKFLTTVPTKTWSLRALVREACHES